MRILVTGATGYVGGRLVPRLVAAGHDVVCLARDPGRLAGRGWPVDVRRGDVLDCDSLPPALQGIEVAYYLVHAMREGARGFEERDEHAARNFARAAREAGVGRIVYLGGLGAGEARLSPHLASRQRVGEVLRSSGVPVTEFRAAVVIGSGSISFEMIRYLTERLPVMITPRWLTTRCQPIAIDDVLAYLTQCLDEPASVGRTFEIGGPEVLTYGEMMRRYAAARGLRRLLIPVPVLTPHLSSYWVDLVTPIPASYSHPLIEGLRSEVVVRDDSARQVFAIKPTPYDVAVRLALDLTRAGQIETYWAEARGPLKPGVSLKAAEGMIAERRRVTSAAAPEAVFATLAGIGGRRGWFFADRLWQLRGLLDRLAGGVGMRRGRRSPDELRPGDALDFWRVEAIEPDRLLRLRAEMRTPGPAWLQFEVTPQSGGGSLLTQTAYFQPHGLAGLAYWYGLYPIHQSIFSGLAQAIARRAEAR
jgi:uncharacterized protein YbjT (DUF2867 family)/uncharacterized protein YndB with AHSA1/START domain